MSFHYSNFGAFSSSLQTFADLNGYVPGLNDGHEEMSWDAMTSWDDESWSAFVADAIVATERAASALGEWRQSGA